MTEMVSQALLLDAAQQKQRLAADPGASVWVRANAGTGKTHVLVQRILRLLLSGADPRSILCLTFTKNTAAEMEGRVLAALGEWAIADETALISHLVKLLARPPSSQELATARCLFASIIDAPGGLGVMTIHGFCERLLRRYALEANVPPAFDVLTEEEARDALREATANALTSSAVADHLRDALTTIVAYANEAEFTRVLEAMLSKRNALTHLLRLSSDDDPVAGVVARLRQVFGLQPGETTESLRARALSVLDDQTLAHLMTILGEGGKSDVESKARFEAVLKAKGDDAKLAALRTAFCTREGEPRKSLMTSSLSNRFAALHQRLVGAQSTFTDLDRKICSLRSVKATEALLNLTAAIFTGYDAERGVGPPLISMISSTKRSVYYLGKRRPIGYFMSWMPGSIIFLLMKPRTQAQNNGQSWID